MLVCTDVAGSERDMGVFNQCSTSGGRRGEVEHCQCISDGLGSGSGVMTKSVIWAASVMTSSPWLIESDAKACVGRGLIIPGGS